MAEFKKTFVVKSKSRKIKEKEDETSTEYHTFLQSAEEGNSMRINLHSAVQLPLNLNDELELRVVKFQKKMKE